MSIQSLIVTYATYGYQVAPYTAQRTTSTSTSTVPYSDTDTKILITSLLTQFRGIFNSVLRKDSPRG